MKRIIKSMENKYLVPSLDLVEKVFTEYDCEKEGNPKNYNPRGFVTSADYGIVAGPKIHLPHISCLMIKELENGALENMKVQLINVNSKIEKVKLFFEG